MNIVEFFRRLFSKPSPAPAPLPPATSPVRVEYNDTRIPPSAQTRIRKILVTLDEVQDAASREATSGINRFDLEQMRDLHLPKLVKSYIDIPPAHRAEIFRKTGKSASFILDESLDKMQDKLDDMMRSLAQHDLDAFTHNTQFIGQRYADKDNPFL
ncbi:hypothetical protein ABAC460_22930 [Asticcacaulis sp. AC460]|uniref:hypothetical protein n=1 Tax=Asticcacaulis sp. AC460 TaxID=1282360 RepID=UPI0003C3B066|nr:hypothetical protein [Asticcacaulis sp. AC460]ESQ86571.1 hypothetical protein ABAC460_22930 [Asticcacaulis sp. AC460]